MYLFAFSGTKLLNDSHLPFSKASSLARFEKTCLTGSFGIQIPRDICTRFGRYLYSTKLSWITIVYILSFETVEVHQPGKSSFQLLIGVFSFTGLQYNLLRFLVAYGVLTLVSMAAVSYGW